jgi:hypothetical protein
MMARMTFWTVTATRKQLVKSVQIFKITNVHGWSIRLSCVSTRNNEQFWMYAITLNLELSYHDYHRKTMVAMMCNVWRL